MSIKISGVTVVDNSRNIVNVDSATFTGTGSIKAPVGSTIERPATPTQGMMRYNSDKGLFEYYGDGVWANMGGANGEGGSVFFENDTAITSSYTIPENKNAGTFGPVTINNGVVVTISDNSTWKII